MIDTNNDFFPNVRILFIEIFNPIPAIAITSKIFDAFWKNRMIGVGIKLNDVRTEMSIKPVIKYGIENILVLLFLL